MGKGGQHVAKSMKKRTHISKLLKSQMRVGGKWVWGRFILLAVDFWMAGGPGKWNSHGTYSLAIFTSASALCRCFRVMEM